MSRHAARHDRRGHARFEILGRVWGTLETTATMTVYNISLGGALVASPVPLDTDSVHQIAVRRGSAQAAVHVRVRHARRDEAGEGAYAIGMEFIELTPVLRALVEAAAAEEYV